jgi:hypothetical protein
VRPPHLPAPGTVTWQWRHLARKGVPVHPGSPQHGPAKG